MSQGINPMPDELMEKLRQATGHFHDSRKGLEQAMDTPEYEHQTRVEAAHDQVRQAEHELEAIEDEISKRLPASEK